ncbi:MAG: hypothetical protein JWP87_5049 [Labilithrix sp.]|jgi:hypothetical protein|nr:hypothetical protein [Labilithrix sp.]
MNSNQKQAGRIRDARAAAHRSDDGEAFLPDPTNTDSHYPLGATDGESFAEEFIASATGGEPVEMDAQDEVIEEEWGGPFLELDAESGDGSEPIPEPPLVHKLPPRLH